MNRDLRALLKAMSWRLVGTVDTFCVAAAVSYLATGSVSFALASGIAGTEVLTKVALYYAHERVWDRAARA